MITLEKSPGMIPNAAKHELTHLHATQDAGPMQLHFGEAFEIRDLGSHTPATVTTLALLLAGDVDVRCDPKRKNFYEVVDGSQVYYIHVSPVSGIIYLLAVWQNAVAQCNSQARPLPGGMHTAGDLNWRDSVNSKDSGHYAVTRS